MTSLYELSDNQLIICSQSIIIDKKENISFKDIFNVLYNFASNKNVKEYGPYIILYILGLIKPISPTVSIISFLFTLYKKYREIKTIKYK